MDEAKQLRAGAAAGCSEGQGDCVTTAARRRGRKKKKEEEAVQRVQRSSVASFLFLFHSHDLLILSAN